MSLGDKVPVPILDHDSVYLVDPDWSDAEIATQHPGLSTAARKAFTSLRSRLALRPVDTLHDEIGYNVADLLKQPVRSHYWLSRLSALVRSAFDGGSPPAELLEAFESARLLWIERFASKSSLKMILSAFQIPNLHMDERVAADILARRFEDIVVSKGIHTPQNEIIHIISMFKEGLIAQIEEISIDQFDYWKRKEAIVSLTELQVENLFRRFKFFDADMRGMDSSPGKWSSAELRKYLAYFRAIDADNYNLNSSTSQFISLYEAQKLATIDILSYSNDWYSAMIGDGSIEFIDKLLHFIDGKDEVEHGKILIHWPNVISSVKKEYEKLTILARIVNPAIRNHDDDEVAINGINYSLLEELLRSAHNVEKQYLRLSRRS
ncbi:hypothetical protein [uncultured Hoeflea sp.]|uniref:hypothetical protein n=1 Tax=uncultured Hoeflea sp. TaxID=538666 RepID=UPI002609889F|nr:hypothetical protein [uncultured Hoeflea sp.]